MKKTKKKYKLCDDPTLKINNFRSTDKFLYLRSNDRVDNFKL